MVFDEIFGHAQTGVLDDELAGDLLARPFEHMHLHVDGPVGLVVFHAVGEQIHQDFFQMQRTAADVNARKIIMLTGDGKTGGFRLKQHRIGNAVADFIQIHGFAPQNDGAVFQLSHIQHIVHQRQQQLRGQLDFMQTVAHARVVVLIFSDDSQHADDAVDGCADIVRHVVQERCFGGVGSLGLRERLLQLCLALLQPEVQLLRLFGGLPGLAEQTEQQQREQDEHSRGSGQIVLDKVRSGDLFGRTVVHGKCTGQQGRRHGFERFVQDGQQSRIALPYGERGLARLCEEHAVQLFVLHIARQLTGTRYIAVRTAGPHGFDRVIR